MANVEAKHETVLDAPARQTRLARVYAEALLNAAQQESPEAVESVGAELAEFVHGLDEHPEVVAFLVSPAAGKKAKSAALGAALSAGASDLLRGLVSVLAQNNRLDLLRSVSRAYTTILNERAGRVPVKVTSAVELTSEQQEKLTANLKKLLRGEPVVDVRVDPDLLGGMIVRVGDSVIDTSVRSRLLSLRSIMLEQ